MMSLMWVLYGVIYSLFRACFAEINRIFKIDGWQLNFWHAVFGLIGLSFFAVTSEWPRNIHFYIASVLVGLVMMAGALVQLNLSARRSGRIFGMHIPIEAVATFLLWLMLVPSSLQSYIDNPGTSAALLVCFLVSVIGLLRVRERDKGWKMVTIVVPGAVALAAASIMIKYMINIETLPDSAFVFAFITYLVMALFMGPVLVVKEKIGKDLLESRTIKAGLMTGVASVLSYISFIYSLAYADNPAYPVVLSMLVPVWLFGLHRLIGFEDQAKPLYGLMTFAGVIGFLYFAI